MSSTKTIEIPVIQPKIKLNKRTKKKLLNKADEESQVIVHCVFKAHLEDCRIRIWKSTFLYSKNNTHKSKLLHIENISVAPRWTDLKRGESRTFTLIFSALPKSCKVFDFVEEIKEPMEFTVRNIARNKSDVYTITLS